MNETQTYSSYLTDEQWRQVQPLLPQCKIGKVGRPRTVAQRHVLDAILSILRSGSPLRLLLHDFPPGGTVSSPFDRWRQAGLR